jgi:ribonuclease P protein component
LKSEKLNLNKDFRRLYGRGRSMISPVLVTYVQNNRLGVIRYGITSGKKVGCAVMRNRARRVIAAAARECFPYLDCGGADIVFVARGKTPYTKSTEIARVMKEHLEKLGLIPENTQ